MWSPDTASFVTARRLRTFGLFDSSVAGFASAAAGFASAAFSVSNNLACSSKEIPASAVAGFAATSAFGVASAAGFTSSAFSEGAAGVSVTAFASVAKAEFGSSTLGAA